MRFTSVAIREAVDSLVIPPGGVRRTSIRHTQLGETSWDFDTDEEFYAEYGQDPEWATLDLDVYAAPPDGVVSGLRLLVNRRSTEITVRGQDRVSIERVFAVFKKHEKDARLPAAPAPIAPAPTVFIGHGRAPLWRDLKDHLAEQHDYRIAAYEVGARAGHSIRDILEEMLDASAFAVLVMTAEDEMADGSLRPRENVVHEVGLFQGQLGFRKAIVLVEDGVTPFSNLQGIQWITFSQGNIREAFGDVLAALRREFGAS